MKTHTLIISENNELSEYILFGEGLITIEESAWYMVRLKDVTEIKIALAPSNSNSSIDDVMNGNCEVKLAIIDPSIKVGEVVTQEDRYTLIDMDDDTVARVTVNQNKLKVSSNKLIK